jgi:hypothetical protein
MDNQSTLHVPFSGMFEMTSNSLFFLYLNNTQLQDYRLPDYFRGLVFSEGASSTTPKHILFGHTNEIHGSIHIKDRIFRLQSAGGPFDIHFEPDVIRELNDLGLFSIDDDDDDDDDEDLIIVDDHLRGVLLSRSY